MESNRDLKVWMPQLQPGEGQPALPLREQEAERIENCRRKGLQYLQQGGYLAAWQEFEEMRIGHQWPSATPRTRHLPRPVFNIIELMVNHKLAQVLNENMKIVFLPEGRMDLQPEQGQAARFYTRFAEMVWQDLNFGEIVEQALDNAATYGCGIWHFYWDAKKAGRGPFKYSGGIAAEVIDPVNCYFGNPQQRDVQKQPWILIASREEVAKLRVMAKANGLPEMGICADRLGLEFASEAARNELDEQAKATLLTRYFRGENGHIYYAQAAAGQLITPPTDSGLTLYPLEVMSWKIRKNSIYGISEVEGAIPNQKGLNFVMAMMMLSVQDTAWPKILTKPGALNQQLTNVPGEVVVDHYGVGDGIKYLAPAPFSGAALSLVDHIYDLTRGISGLHQVATGEIYNPQMSGAAIVALQQASAMPVEQIKKRFVRALVNIGRIWEDFFKHKYNTSRMLVLENAEGRGERPIRFTPADYVEVPMDLKIDVGPGTSFSDVLMMTNLENFLEKGHISFEEALEFMPDSAVPFRAQLLEQIRQRGREA